MHKGHMKFSCYRVPEAELSLAHPGESCGEDVSISCEDGSHWPDALVWSKTFLLVSRGTKNLGKKTTFMAYLFYFRVGRGGELSLKQL